MENRIEPANLLQRPLVKRHVAARNVLRLAVGQHDVRRAARRNHDRRRHQRVLRRQEVGAAHARKSAPQQPARQIVEPVLVRPAIGVREGDDLARRRRDARIARHREAEVLLVAKVADVGMREGDLPRRIGRAVIHQDHLVVRVIEPCQRIQAGLERALAVVAGHHDRDLGTARQREVGRRVEHLSARLRNAAFGCRSRVVSPICQSSTCRPPRHQSSVKVNTTAPANPPRKALLTCHSSISAWRASPSRRRVNTAFAQQQGLALGQHLQAREVTLERLPLVQIDIETEEVHALRAQKLGGRIIRKGAQAIRVRPFGLLDQVINEVGDGLRAAPAQNVRGNLVGDAQREDRRMAGAGERSPAHRFSRFGSLGGESRKQRCLFQGMSMSTLSLCSAGQVEKPLGRDVVNPDEVGPEFADLRKVPGGLLRRSERLAGCIRRKRTIRQALGVEFPFAEPEELAVHA